jgi:hypothetical protein
MSIKTPVVASGLLNRRHVVAASLGALGPYGARIDNLLSMVVF